MKRLNVMFVVLCALPIAACGEPENEGGDGGDDLVISVASWPDPVEGSYFSELLTATGPGADYRWSISSGALPPGVLLPSRGTPRNQLFGTPTAAGLYSFTVSVHNDDGDTATRAIQMTVQSAGAMREDTTEVAPATVGRTYFSPLAASGGTGSGYYWTVTGGALPPGMFLDSTGTPPPAIKGVPTASGDYAFSLQVVDAGSGIASRDFTLHVEPAGMPLRIITRGLPGGVAGNAYGTQVHAVGGTGNLTFDLTSGSPGNGITYTNLSSLGEWGGTPSGPMIQSIGLRVRDGSGAIELLTVSLAIDGPLNITTTAMQSAVSGTSYNRQVHGEGGSAEGYTWQVTAGALPPGLSLSAVAVTPSVSVVGVPTQLGTFAFTIQLQDSLGATTTRNLSILVATVSNPLQITTSSLPDATDGLPYSAQVTAVNGSASNVWHVIAGILPPGMSLSVNGHPSATISGTCSVTGDYNFTVEVTEGAETAAAVLSIKVRPVLAVVTSNLPNGMQGQIYSETITASGGNSTGFTWQVTQGALPPGLSLAASGTPSTILSGTPTATGQYNFTIAVTDSDQNTGDAALGMFVDANGVINTIAGTGNTLPTPDGAMPLMTNFYDPCVTRLDPAGNLVILERGNHRIRRIAATSGLVETVAGSGAQGQTGDGGQATAAAFDLPNDFVFDAAGNMYIADAGNRVIRRVDTSGIVTRFAGTGNGGFSGDFGAALGANIDTPFSMVVHAGSLYFCASNARLRAIDLSTNIITSVAGGGATLGDGGLATQCRLGSAFALDFDAAGNLYIADSSQHRVRRIDATTGIIDTVVGAGGGSGIGDGGPAYNAGLLYPMGLCFDAAGNLLISDSQHHRIRMVSVASGIIQTIAGNGTGTFSGDGGQATAAQVFLPRGIRVEASGAITFCDSANNRVRRITP